MSLTKIAQDLALMGSGPRAGIGEIFLPELQKGSSIMPGKVNPVLPEVVLQVSAQVIGNDTAITIGGMQGQFELNVRIPLIARNLLQSIHLLSTTTVAFAEKCVDGIEVNKAGTKASAEGTLAAATALNGAIGYDAARHDRQEGRGLRAPAARGRAGRRRRREGLRRDDQPAQDRGGQPGLAGARAAGRATVPWSGASRGEILTTRRPHAGQKLSEATADEHRLPRDLGAGEADDRVAGKR